jgi:hypothetical protein
MPEIKISQTSAFKLCEKSSCDDPKESVGEVIECKAGEKCKGKGCYCQLFPRKKGSDDPWDVTPTNGAHEGKKKAGLEYTCLCVKPILPKGYTLCDTPLCNLTDSHTAGEAAQVECTGTCADECSCNLFRLYVKPKKAEKKADVEWEFLAKSGTKKQRDGAYYYRCF